MIHWWLFIGKDLQNNYQTKTARGWGKRMTWKLTEFICIVLLKVGLDLNVAYGVLTI